MGSSVASIASRWSASRAWLCAALVALSASCASPGPSAEGEGDLPFYSTADFTAEWIAVGDRAGRDIHRISPFSFTNQDGRQVTNASLRGKIYVADFFFTSCPSMCPKLTRTFKRIQDAFAGDPDVELVSHTVDPTTDTPDRLAAFAREQGVTSGKWHLVTGDPAVLYTLARTSYFAEKQLGLKKGTDEFLHTENMLLVDREGHIRGVYNATLPAEAARVIEDIRVLKGER
jgi:protein SCO1/2